MDLHTNDVYIKHPELQEEKFDPNQYNHINRIEVNLNTVPLFYPSGRLGKNGYVHIFNWNSFLRIVRDLDTIPDFINYLKIREEVFNNKEALLLIGSEGDWDTYTGAEFHKYMSTIDTSKKPMLLLSGDELDLLADYYFTEKRFNAHFYSKEYTYLSYELDGKWEDYLSRKEVQRKKQDEKLSYFIDEFFKREVLYTTDRYNLGIATELLSLSRFERRIVEKHFFDFVERYMNQSGPFIARRYGKVNDLAIGFLLHGREVQDDMVFKLMDIAINGYCYWDNYQTKKVILIACSNRLMSFKHGYIDDVTLFEKVTNQI